MAQSRYDAIVVGAGFGGSSCAGLLAKRGLRVLLRLSLNLTTLEYGMRLWEIINRCV